MSTFANGEQEPYEHIALGIPKEWPSDERMRSSRLPTFWQGALPSGWHYGNRPFPKLVGECDECGRGFTASEWENRHQPHATFCEQRCHCSCDLNVHEDCCAEFK